MKILSISKNNRGNSLTQFVITVFLTASLFLVGASWLISKTIPGVDLVPQKKTVQASQQLSKSALEDEENCF